MVVGRVNGGGDGGNRVVVGVVDLLAVLYQALIRISTLNP